LRDKRAGHEDCFLLDWFLILGASIERLTGKRDASEHASG
jgi:hypothetical protein